MLLGRLTAMGAVCLTAAVGFSGVATGDSDGSKAPLEPIQSLSTPAVPVPDVPPIQTPDVAGVNVPDVPAVQTPDVPAVDVPTPPPSGPSQPSTSAPAPPQGQPQVHSQSQPASNAPSSSKAPEHTQAAPGSNSPHHATTKPAGGKQVKGSRKSERTADRVARRTRAAKARTRVAAMPRLRPTDALNDSSGRLLRVDAVTASSSDSAAPRNGDRGTTAGAIESTSDGWSAPLFPLLFLGGLGLIAFTVMGNRVYAPAPAQRGRGGASDRPDPQTSERGDADAADSSLGSTASDVSPGDKVVAPGPPAVSTAAVTTTAMPSAARAHDGVQRAADGDSSPEVFTYTVRRRSGGLVGAARKGLESLRTRR